MALNLNFNPSNIFCTEQGTYIRFIAWIPPSDDSWRLNFGSYNEDDDESGFIGVGCLLRDDKAVFKAGYADAYSDCGDNITLVELKALKVGLLLAVKNGVDYIEIEGDNSIVVRILKGEIIPLCPVLKDITAECVEIMIKSFRQIIIRRIDVNGNKGATGLAIVGFDNQKTFSWQNEAPQGINKILINDVIGRWIAIGR
ncbi:Ribonuclease H-like domain containing protein [Quillaja saponaria]|uniref:Ribonuclease H-like domain containing protein n=1 Tax=Quillaja saponaria TaxID=32244 RepID=A0AAD7LUS7_QUISA|nr:Ribonuclease H-like domain containing protein [Quillaja saponaria]